RGHDTARGRSRQVLCSVKAPAWLPGPRPPTFRRPGGGMNPAPFIIDEHVRWSDVDAAGIIFYGSYIRFIELAETELFRAAGMPYGEVFDRYDVLLPRVQVHTEFHYPARLDDQLRMAVYYGK